MRDTMIAIRLARLDELDALLDLVRAAVRHMESQGIHQWDDVYPDRATLRADIDKHSLQLLEVNGLIAGIMSIDDQQPREYRDVPWKYPGRALVVHRLCIDPGYQRRGLATHLMEFVQTTAEARGYDTVRLDAFTQNRAASALYERLGYEKAGTVQFRKGLFFCFEKQTRRTGPK